MHHKDDTKDWELESSPIGSAYRCDDLNISVVRSSEFYVNGRVS
jgi:hypothetical protein